MDSKSLPSLSAFVRGCREILTPNAESMPVPIVGGAAAYPYQEFAASPVQRVEIISPVPYVEVIHGFSSSGSRSGSPLAADISITAVFTPPDLNAVGCLYGLPKGVCNGGCVRYLTPPL